VQTIVRRGMRHKSQDFDLGAIRNLLSEAFTAVELRRFCQDRALFAPVVAEFGHGQGVQASVDALIDYCRTRRLFGELLTEVEQERPRQYARYTQRLAADPLDREAWSTTAGPGHGSAPAPRRVGDWPSGPPYGCVTLSSVAIGAILGTHGPSRGVCVLLTEQATKVIVGRTAGAGEGVAIPDHYMSRSHFIIRVIPAEGDATAEQHAIELYDLSTAGRTLVNGERAHRTLLQNGDVIQAGTSVFKVILFTG
jgi:hypothetical protein